MNSLRYLPGPEEVARLSTKDLRRHFLVEELFTPGEVRLICTDLDRAIVGGVVPTANALRLEAGEALRAEYFLQRRELGVINLGGSGSMTVDCERYEMAHLDALYVGRGTREIESQSDDAASPAAFYLVSYPAHTEYPTQHATPAEAVVKELGSQESANERKICQYIHEDGIKSCQLVMGFTELNTGSVWNTMPPHTHDRRSEVYCYFDITEPGRVLHMMGEPSETRPLWVGERQVVLSPPWSIHCGVGTGAYRFVWAMGGENQQFTDMDAVPLEELR